MPFRLSSNGVGHVLGDTANNVRAQPDASSAVVGQVAPNVWFTVLAGPVCSDGLAWWQIGNPEDEFGWTAEGADTEYWIFSYLPRIWLWCWVIIGTWQSVSITYDYSVATSRGN